MNVLLMCVILENIYEHSEDYGCQRRLSASFTGPWGNFIYHKKWKKKKIL